MFLCRCDAQVTEGFMQLENRLLEAIDGSRTKSEMFQVAQGQQLMEFCRQNLSPPCPHFDIRHSPALPAPSPGVPERMHSVQR